MDLASSTPSPLKRGGACTPSLSRSASAPRTRTAPRTEAPPAPPRWSVSGSSALKPGADTALRAAASSAVFTSALAHSMPFLLGGTGEPGEAGASGAGGPAPPSPATVAMDFEIAAAIAEAQGELEMEEAAAAAVAEAAREADEEDIAYAGEYARDARAAADAVAQREAARAAEEAAETADVERRATEAARASAAAISAAAVEEARAAAAEARALASDRGPTAAGSGTEGEAEARALVAAFESTQAQAIEHVLAGGLQPPPGGRPSTARDPLGLSRLQAGAKDLWTVRNISGPIRMRVVALRANHDSVNRTASALTALLQAAWAQDVASRLLPAGGDVLTPRPGAEAAGAVGPHFAYASDFLISCLCDNVQPARVGAGGPGASEDEVAVRDLKLYAVSRVIVDLFSASAPSPTGGVMELGLRFRSRYLAYVYQAIPAAAGASTPLSTARDSAAGSIFSDPSDRSSRLPILRTVMTVHAAVLQTRIAVEGGPGGAGVDVNPLGVAAAWTLFARVLSRLGPGGKGSAGLLGSLPSSLFAALTLSITLDIAGYALGRAYGNQFVKVLAALYRQGLPRLLEGRAELALRQSPDALALRHLLDPKAVNRFDPTHVLLAAPPQLPPA